MKRDSENHLQELRKFVAPEFVFGIGARRLVARYATNLGSGKILLVSDPGVQAAGWTKQAETCLKDAGFPCVTYLEVSPNPRSEEVMAGAGLFVREHCDAIVAVGGGSTIDCAKGIGIVVAEKRSILEFEGVDRIGVPIPPMICVPTTSGSSADVSQFAIITDCRAKSKIAIVSKAIVPDISLIDPLTLTTLPTAVAVATGMDAVTHAFEAYVSNAQSATTDLFALEAVRLLFRFLPAVLKEPQNLEYRSQVMLGSMNAGLAFSNASLGAVHAMSHAVGGLLDIAHGDCNSVLLPHVVSFNYPAAPERYRSLAVAAGADLGTARKPVDEVDAQVRNSLVAKVVELQETLGAPRRFRDYGMKLDNIPRLVELALKDACMVTNPGCMTFEDVKEVYEKTI